MQIQSRHAATPFTLNSALVPSDEHCPTIQFSCSDLTVCQRESVEQGGELLPESSCVSRGSSQSSLKEKKHQNGETVIHLFSASQAEMRLSVNVLQAMKSDLLTNLNSISSFSPLTMKLAVPVTVPASLLPPFPACSPILPCSCMRISQEAGL